MKRFGVWYLDKKAQSRRWTAISSRLTPKLQIMNSIQIMNSLIDSLEKEVKADQKELQIKKDILASLKMAREEKKAAAAAAATDSKEEEEVSEKVSDEDTAQQTATRVFFDKNYNIKTDAAKNTTTMTMSVVSGEIGRVPGNFGQFMRTLGCEMKKQLRALFVGFRKDNVDQDEFGRYTYTITLVFKGQFKDVFFISAKNMFMNKFLQNCFMKWTDNSEMWQNRTFGHFVPRPCE